MKASQKQQYRLDSTTVREHQLHLTCIIELVTFMIMWWMQHLLKEST